MSTTLAINPMPLSVPNTPPSDVNVSLVNVKDLRLVKETYGQSGEVFKLLVGKISGKSAYVLQAPNGEQMLLKDLQGNLVTDPGEVERIVQMITGGQLTAGPFVAVPLAGHALVLVAAAIGTFSWSYLSATTKQQKEEALNQFGEAIKDVVKKFPEQAGNIYQHIQETLNTWGGQGALLLAWFRGMFGNASNPVAKPPPTQTPRVSNPASPPTQTPRVNNPATSPQTQTPGVVNNPASPQTQIPGVVINPWTTPTNPTSQPTPEELKENLTKLRTQLNEAVQGTIGSHEDFVTLWNRLGQRYENLAALPVSLRDPLPPGVTLTELLPEMQRKLFDRRLASLQSTLSVEDPNVVRAVQQQLELLEKFVKDRPGLNEGGVSAYALDKIKQLRQEINLRFSPGGTRDQTTAEFNMATVAQQLQSLGAKYPGLKMYLQGILRLPTEERTKALQALLNGGTASAPGMPPLKPDDQKTLGMVIEGLCNALGSAVFDSLEGKPLDQQLQGIGIAFVVGVLTADNLQTRIDIFVANALAAGGEAYVRQLAGLDPVQDGLNNIFTMLIGGGGALGMHEVAELVRRSLFKLKPELVGELPNWEGAGPGNDPGDSTRYEARRGRRNDPPRQPNSGSGSNSNSNSSAIDQEAINRALQDTGEPRTSYSIRSSREGKQPYTLEQLVKALNKDLSIGGNNGYPRSDETHSKHYVKILFDTDLLQDVMELGRYALNANEANELVLKGYADTVIDKRQKEALKRWQIFAQEIERKIKLGEMNTRDALSALMAAADALNIAPNKPSSEFSTLIGGHAVKFIEADYNAAINKIMPSVESSEKFLREEIGLSQNNINHLIDHIKNEYKILNGGRSLPEKNSGAHARAIIDGVKSRGGTLLSIIGAGYVISQIVDMVTAPTRLKTAQNLSEGQRLSEGTAVNEAADAFAGTSYNLTTWSPYISSGAFSTLFEFFPEIKTELDSKVSGYDTEVQNYAASPNKEEYLRNKDKTEERMRKLTLIANHFDTISKTFYKYDIDLLPPAQRDRLLNNLSLAQKEHNLNQNGELELTGKDWLDLLVRMQPNLADAFLSSAEYKELTKKWQTNGWVKLSPNGSDWVLADPANADVRNKMKEGFKQELEGYVEKQVQAGERAFKAVSFAVGALANVFEMDLRLPLYQNFDISNIGGPRNFLASALDQVTRTKLTHIAATVDAFNSRIDAQASMAITSLTTAEQDYVDRANREYNQAFDVIRTITSSISNISFNEDTSTIRGDIEGLGRYKASIDLYRKQLLESRGLTGSDKKNIPPVVSAALSKMDELIQQIGREQNNLRSELTRQINAATTQEQNRQSQEIAKKAQVIAQAANEQRATIEVIDAFQQRRIVWNDRIATFTKQETNQPSYMHDAGSWATRQEQINGFTLPPPPKGKEKDDLYPTLELWVQKVLRDLEAAGAFAPEITGTDRKNNGILHDADSAEKVIWDYYNLFKVYRTEEPTPTQPPTGLRYGIPGQ
jgi:hypothetical protein